MTDFIFIAGSPGSGKTTISNLLKTKLKNTPLIDFGWIREFHLDKEWKNANKKEEQMSFENLFFILTNYVKHGYKNIIVNDLQDFRIEQIHKKFLKYNYVIISLIIKDDEELKNRVLGERDSGFKDVKTAVSWNNKIIKRKNLKNEFKIDNTHRIPEKTVNTILELIEKNKK
ncbi:AAA family ATPase [Candidatus Woesearchaeota archaeon]|nr:AAA family ATPase [Candidatus Woesearchaeota archaeon]